MSRIVPLISLVLAASAVGCVTHYATTDDVPPRYAEELKSIERYYLLKAKEQAAFTAHCAPDQVTMQVVSTKPATLLAGDRESVLFVVKDFPQIATIGAEACGTRQIYQVLCGPREVYGDVARLPYGRPCDVVPSTEALRVVQQNLEQQHQDDAAAAAASAARKK